MVGAHLAAPIGGKAAYLEAFLVKIHARFRIVHILVVLRQAVFQSEESQGRFRRQ